MSATRHENMLRKIDPSDVTVVAEMVRELAAATGLSGKAQANPKDFENALFSEPVMLHGVIAEIDGKPQGVCLYHPRYSSWRGESGVYILDLLVRTTARGKGLGRLLLGAAMRDGIDLWDARFASLDMDKGNDSAKRFYDRLGFKSDDSEFGMKLLDDGFHRLAKHR